MLRQLDRSEPPQGQPLKNTSLPAFETLQLSNGISVHLLPYGTVDVVEVQAIFRAGNNFQPQAGIAQVTALNMLEGTQGFGSLQLAQLLDGNGAWLNASTEEEALSFKLATITDRLGHTLPLLRSVILEPTFPEEEFTKMKQRTLQKMNVSAQKTSTQARRHFSAQLFGENHPYGRFYGQPELESIQRKDLQTYFQQYLQPGNFCLTVVGKFNAMLVMDQLEVAFGSLPLTSSITEPLHFNSPKAITGRHYVEQKGMQATLRLGHLGMSRNNPDYDKMMVVNTLLGGYFGSRLMKNIREEKGYTYGIYSGWIGQKNEGYFVVQSDVGNEYIEPTISEVKKEMNLLIEKGAGVEELDLVKNYLIGRNISSRETPFQLGDLLRFSISTGISFEELDDKFHIIQEIQPEEIATLAQKYLSPDKMLEVVVGEYPQ